MKRVSNWGGGGEDFPIWWMTNQNGAHSYIALKSCTWTNNLYTRHLTWPLTMTLCVLQRQRSMPCNPKRLLPCVISFPLFLFIFHLFHSKGDKDSFFFFFERKWFFFVRISIAFEVKFCFREQLILWRNERVIFFSGISEGQWETMNRMMMIMIMMTRSYSGKNLYIYVYIPQIKLVFIIFIVIDTLENWMKIRFCLFWKFFKVTRARVIKTWL